MIPISKANEILAREVRPLATERVELEESVGRILAENVVADTDLPPFDRSQMDGFGLIAVDTTNAPVSLKIVGESAAGNGWHNVVKSGEAVRIMTGAPVPKGADAVQKIELTSEVSSMGFKGASRAHAENETVSVLKTVEKGNSIVRRGVEIKKGAVVFRKGEIVTTNMIAALAAFGYAKVKVSRRPRLAVLATGSEIVPSDKKPKRDQIRNSNSPMVRALAEKFGCEVEVLPLVHDNLDALKKAIAGAVAISDILVITGGVSVGKYDLTKVALADLRAQIHFERVRLKPGKPTVFATLGKKLVFGLPGNPVSVAVTFQLFVRTVILAKQGCAETGMKLGYAVAASAIKGTKERDTYLPAILTTNKSGQLVAEPTKWLGSSDFIGYSRAEALVIVPSGKRFEKGGVVRIAWL
jgi:molybdopterin molybdotransferase